MTSDRRRPLAAALFLLCLGCYLANGRLLPAAATGDSFPARLIPFSILAFHTVTLDPFGRDFQELAQQTWFLTTSRGSLLSVYPLGSSLVVLPIYAPYYAWVASRGRGDHRSLFVASIALEKVSAAVVAALAVSLLYLVLRRLVPSREAAWTAVAFGVATAIWSIASQVLWQHGPTVLMLVLGLLFLTWPSRPLWSTALAGSALAMAYACRPTSLFWLLAGFAVQALEPGPPRRRLVRLLAFAGGAAPLLALVHVYNTYYFGLPLGVYQGAAAKATWSLLNGSRAPRGLAGLLLSPNRGLLIFTPIAVLGLVGAARSLRRVFQEPLLPCFTLAAAAVLGVSALFPWWGGGWSFGPRYLTDLMPTLALGGARELARLHRWGKLAWLPALVWSGLVQLDGAFCYPASQWNARAPGGDIEKAAWDRHHFELWEDFQAWRQQPFLASPYAPPDWFAGSVAPCVAPGASDRQLVEGWYAPDRDGRWMKGRARVVVGPPLGPSPRRLVLRGVNWGPRAVHVAAMAEGAVVLDAIVPPGGYQTVGAFHPRWSAGPWVVSLFALPTFVPSNGDTRKLGTFVQSICLE